MAEQAGIFAQMGLDMRTQEEILADRKKDLIEQAAMDSGRPESFAGEEDLRRAGRMLGAAISNPELSTEEAKQVEALGAAQARYAKEVENSDIFRLEDGSVDHFARSMAQQRIIGEELIRVGDERGFALLKDAMANMETVKTGRANREQLRVNAESTEVTTEGKVTANLLAKNGLERGKAYTVFKRGESDPEQGFVAYMQPDGTFKDSEGNTYDSGELTTFRPLDHKRGVSGRPLTALDYGISKREAGAIRDMSAATTKMMRGSVRMKEAIEDSYESLGFVGLMDGPGKLTGAAVKTIDFLTNTGKQIEAAMGWNDPVTVKTEGGDLSGLDKRGSSMTYARANLEELDNMMQSMVPENIRGSERARQEYYATLVQMVYAKARANEPGARQLSDADFKNAMMAMAGSVSDPEAFRRVTYGNILEDVAHLNTIITNLPDPVRDGYMIISKKGTDAFYQELERFESEFGPTQPFGTAEQPGVGITGGDEEQGSLEGDGYTVVDGVIILD